MLTPMRRKKQQMDKTAIQAVLDRCDTAILAVTTEAGYPYAVPINFVYGNGKIYFHSGKKGLKMESLKNNPKVSLCIVGADTVLPKTFSTDYESVILFGNARVVTEDAEKLASLRLLCAKTSPQYQKEGEEEIKKSWNAVEMVAIEIEQVTGKISGNRVK